MNKKSTPVPRLLLERYLLDELAPEEKERVEKAVEQNESVRTELETIRHSNEAILNKYPVSKTAREINLKLHTLKVREKLADDSTGKKTLFEKIGRGPILTAALGILLIIIMPPLLRQGNLPENQQDGIRLKGLSPHLTVYRSTSDSSEKLQNLASASEGDIIQLGYVSAGKRYGVIFSLDGNGTITLHYPSSATADSTGTLLEGEGEKFLESAYELDDAPLFEHFFLITADGPIDIEAILQAGKKLSMQEGTPESNRLLDIPEKWQQSSFVLRKENS